MSNQSNNELLATLRSMSMEELLLVFIEAKTGSQEDIDKLPAEYLSMVNELGDILDTFYADRIINSSFNEK
jgi:hypothetical protein